MEHSAWSYVLLQISNLTRCEQVEQVERVERGSTPSGLLAVGPSQPELKRYISHVTNPAGVASCFHPPINMPSTTPQDVSIVGVRIPHGDPGT